jgi:ribokinase
MPVELTVVGSINLDFVARVERLPRPGETVGTVGFLRNPGGKGANQAVAAARLDARVTMVGAVGEDDLAGEALSGLVGAGVELEVERVGQTGLALIYVDTAGENTIAVVPGANAQVTPREVEGAVLCQLEVSDEVVVAAARKASFFALNASPARPIDIEPDLLIVNRLEYETVSLGKLVAVTFGADGAVLYENGKQVAGSSSPEIVPKDGTAAGDAFAACLVVSLLEERPYEEALRRACTAGAYAAAKVGAQSSLPTKADVEAWLK